MGEALADGAIYTAPSFPVQSPAFYVILLAVLVLFSVAMLDAAEKKR